jgi:hypothetical protein
VRATDVQPSCMSMCVPSWGLMPDTYMMLVMCAEWHCNSLDEGV